jgi:hypothetical protein
MNKLFDYSIAFANAGMVYEDIPASCVEVQAVSIDLTSKDVTWVNDDEANAFGVYLRYDMESDFAKEHSINPSEWIADFSTREAAEKFAKLIDRLMRNGMTKTDPYGNKI